MESDSRRDEGHLTPPISEHPNRTPANISGPRHPSDERRRNREAELVETHHHSTEPADDAAAQHRKRSERHGRRR
jgi:hypothetical protein